MLRNKKKKKKLRIPRLSSNGSKSPAGVFQRTRTDSFPPASDPATPRRNRAAHMYRTCLKKFHLSIKNLTTSIDHMGEGGIGARSRLGAG